MPSCDGLTALCVLYTDHGVDQIQPAEAASPAQCVCQTDALSQHQALTQGNLHILTSCRDFSRNINQGGGNDM